MLQRPSRREARRRNQLRYEARQRVGIGLFLVPLTDQEIDVLLTVAQLFPVSNTLGVLPSLPGRKLTGLLKFASDVRRDHQPPLATVRSSGNVVD
jgi:hypothetical protein